MTLYEVTAAVCGTAMHTMWEASITGHLDTEPTINNPVGIGGAIGDAIERAGKVGMYLLLVSGLFAALSLINRLVQAKGYERQQLKWFVFATALMLGGFFVLQLSSSWPLLNEISFGVGIFGFMFFPVATGIAILRYRLYDIDILINRTLVYGALTIVVVGVYVLVVGYMSTLLQGGAGGNLVISVLATGLVAVLFQPLRERLQRAVNRLMYGQRDEPYAVLSHLGRRLEKARWSPRKRSRPSWRQSPRH